VHKQPPAPPIRNDVADAQLIGSHRFDAHAISIADDRMHTPAARTQFYGFAAPQQFRQQLHQHAFFL
jgi:hypothetical protein